MNNLNVSGQSFNQAIVERAFVSAGQAQIGGIDFKSALANLFEKPQQLLFDFADKTTPTMEISGLGVVDKNNPAAQLMIGVTLTQMETQLNTLLSIVEFSLKTLPQKVESLFS